MCSPKGWRGRTESPLLASAEAKPSATSKALPHNSSAALAMPFLPSASCRNLDLPPVNLRFLQSHLTKNVFVIAPTHLCGIALILFPDLPAPSACAFSLLASVHSTWRSAAALRFIHVSRNEKFAAHLGAFSSGNSIKGKWALCSSLP